MRIVNDFKMFLTVSLLIVVLELFRGREVVNSGVKALGCGTSIATAMCVDELDGDGHHTA